MEAYVSDHSNVRFSHGVCPDCVQTVLKPDLEALRRTRAEREKPAELPGQPWDNSRHGLA